MTSLNKVSLIGRLGADPEVRRMQNGDAVVSLRLATTDSWRDKATGDRKERTEWHTVVIFNEGLAKVAEQYLRKGSQIYVEGSLQTRKWQDQSGADRYSTEVVLQKFRGELVLLGDRGERDEAPRQERNQGFREAPKAQLQAMKFSDEMEDEIPF